VAAVAEIATRYVRDDLVRVLFGAFQNKLGRVVSSTRASARVKIEAFAGREIAVTIPTADLAPASGAA
jgi:ribosomal protein L24